MTSKTVSLCLMVAVGCTSVHATDRREQRSAAPQAPAMAGELIIKLSPEAGQRLDDALKNGKSPAQTGLSWFDELNAHYGVTAVEPVFPIRRDPEAIRRQYPERARRAPPEATVPSLQYTYTLTLPTATDLNEAAAAYAAQPAVEYAQPNYVATVQPAP